LEALIRTFADPSRLPPLSATMLAAFMVRRVMSSFAPIPATPYAAAAAIVGVLRTILDIVSSSRDVQDYLLLFAVA
jgi:hypothetical protein